MHDSHRFLDTRVNDDQAFRDEYCEAKRKKKTKKAFFEEHGVCSEAVAALKTKKMKAVETLLGKEQAKMFKVVIF